MLPYELISFFILVVLQVVGIGATIWHLIKASKDGALSMLVEKDGPSVGHISFSRVAGTLGALTLTCLFVANVFWAHHAMFNGASLERAVELWPIYLFGTALFAPYAFNRMARLGHGGVTGAKPSDDASDA